MASLRLDHLSDDILLARIRAGDAQAFDAFVRVHDEALLGYLARRVGSMDVAADLLQDLFLTLWMRRETIEIRSSARAYLFRAALHRAVDYLRRTRHELRAEHSAATYGAEENTNAYLQRASETDPLVELEHAELGAAIRQTIEHLPERCREIFLLNREGGLSYQEIAEMLGLSVNTVNVQMHRAVTAIRKAIVPFLTIMIAITQ